ncbi:eS1 family ribosomal protein [Nitrososphaera viennensis]|uniref:30S ribosomal protein S3ae n=2 Tax=Nitrososphaera viennensis TaxID=1034015 RepID=A0A060HH27_9ARCH|nr:40S ribosomal protein S3a/S1 [Nitrososphaera viennensis]AIC14655.1 30S ribosomal protein S3ae [Nitrososphaera viennensis EN76]UVS69619.1 40S ribosomal protein S3a/S1 [Nitrososphaera viennensis]
MVKATKKGGRVRDKWRDKQWVIVNKPSGFEPPGSVNYVPITDGEQAKGRVIENTLHDMMKGNPDRSMDQHQIKIFLQIDKISDGTASTRFKGHEYAKEFLRSLIRRGSSMVNFVHDYTTQDGHTFRVAVVAFTQRRVNASKKHEIRMIAHRILSERIPQMTVEQFVQETTGSKAGDIPRETNSLLGAAIMNEAKKISNIRHIGIKKTKLISTPESRAVSDAKPVEATVAEPAPQ